MLIIIFLKKIIFSFFFLLFYSIRNKITNLNEKENRKKGVENVKKTNNKNTIPFFICDNERERERK